MKTISHYYNIITLYIVVHYTLVVIGINILLYIYILIGNTIFIWHETDDSSFINIPISSSTESGRATTNYKIDEDADDYDFSAAYADQRMADAKQRMVEIMQAINNRVAYRPTSTDYIPDYIPDYIQSSGCDTSLKASNNSSMPSTELCQPKQPSPPVNTYLMDERYITDNLTVPNFNLMSDGNVMLVNAFTDMINASIRTTTSNLSPYEQQIAMYKIMKEHFLWPYITTDQIHQIMFMDYLRQLIGCTNNPNVLFAANTLLTILKIINSHQFETIMSTPASFTALYNYTVATG